MTYIRPDHVREPLYAIIPYYNPWQWKSREKHTIRAIKHFQDAGAVVVLVEAAFNRREFAFADSGLDGSPANCGVLGNDHRFKHKFIGVRTKDELWLKENLINIAAAQLPYDWQQLCWLDSDIHFVRPNWVGETIHKLQHYAFLQMFSHARDIAPNYEMLPEAYPHADGEGFVSAWRNGKIPLDRVPGKCKCTCKCNCKDGKCTFTSECDCRTTYPPYPYGVGRIWPGLAWASTRWAWEAVGGLLDVAVWGGGDWHMANALIERTEGMMRNDLHKNYQKVVNQWYQRCRTHIRQNVGVLEGSVLHSWHGRKTERGYNQKHALLAQIGFDPPRHLKRDFQGLWQLHDDRSTAYVQLRDMMRKIARERNEDSNDTRLDLYEQGH